MAERFWVGGGGNWSSTAHWATEADGAGGASVPGVDDVVLIGLAPSSGQVINVDMDVAVDNFITWPGYATGTDPYSIDFNEHSLTLDGNATFEADPEAVSSFDFTNCSITVDRWTILAPGVTLIMTGSTITIRETAIQALLVFTDHEAHVYGNIVLDYTNCSHKDITFDLPNLDITFNNITIQGVAANSTDRYLYGSGWGAMVILGDIITSSIPASSTFNWEYVPLEKDSGTISLHNTRLIECSATGGATFDAFTSNGCEDGGNNTGWIFVGIAEETVEEAITLVDESTGLIVIYYFESLEEAITFLETIIRVTPLLVTDNVLIYDESLQGWISTIIEDLQLFDNHSIILGIPVEDWVTLIDSQANNWNGREIIADGLQIWDLCGLGQIITPSIDESISFVDGTVYKLTVTILEYLGFSELAAAMLTTRFSVSDTVALADASERMFPVDVSVPIGITDTSSSLAFLCALAESQVGITAVSTALNRIAQSISESVVLVETNTTNGLFYSTVSETIKLAVTVELNGEVWECYVLNTPSFHPSIYSGFNFNSYCVFENRAFAANSVGIYELAGSTDAGVQIRTAAVFSQTDFESANQKRFRKGFLGVTGEQVVMVFEAEDGSRKAYEVNSHGDVMASRDLKSKAWKLTVVDYESLGSIQLIPVVLTR